MSQTIGFIGLGLMGAGFCKRLLATGRTVVGYDLDPARRAEADALGVALAASPAEVAERANPVCIAVTTTKAVQAVVSGEGGILSAKPQSGAIVIDFSTTEIGVTKALAAALAEAGIGFIDAPVSGGPPAAEAGKLAIMAGGSPEAIKAVRPLAESLGLFTHMGAVGAGQATKLVNQALCLTNYVVVAESLRLAEAYGVDADKIPAALAPGLGNSAVLQAMMPRMVARDFTPKGYARQVLKDLEMLMEAGREQHLAMPMVAQATTLYRMLVAQGHSELDAIAVLKVLPEAGQAH
ncbi:MULTISPECIES: NAD(P)-dependent oxidoreductase [unclassified Bosea (in: a-proteobacteria)]|uniref:NAD(P)-dependent oxidoreductase n=1 Tax=unclassified Bosea (in: a-proteobacteria) TaxID=2653178 RepID=UPI000F75BCC6|nr:MULTISPECIES: NAD(P)-dependent oxidoreductase [unclassified Bosea (in: a-proteobacteria)]AZO77653.1 2-hydroxy-3-oxopropionate reductase [Bosea sp. Tri-49]RXT18263.1 2-hydroxy-3-oxopropionate reductase [Bosea sp. Tri-39]RXT32859.1 2-hydroxy-3-oxopropionate reductase [Bosea sp. Tri-54]